MATNRKSILSIRQAGVISAAFILISYSTVNQPGQVIHHLTEEDGLFENVGAFFFLSTSLIFLSSFFRQSDSQYFLFKQVERNYSLLVVAILFFFIFGEEISWGQRIFNIEAGDFFKEKNIQNETNLHNLKAFNSVDANNIKRQWWDIFSMSRLFRIFWFTWCFVIPVSIRLFPVFHNFFKKAGIPFIPPLFGVLMIINFGTFKFFENRLGQLAEVVEIEECITAFLFFLIALVNFPVRERRELKTAPIHD